MITATASRIATAPASKGLSARRGSSSTAGAAPVAHLRAAPAASYPARASERDLASPTAAPAWS